MFRIFIFLLVFAGLAYALMPWWVPLGFVRRMIEQDLASKLGTDVRVGRVSLSWAEGVILDGVTILSPDETSDTNGAPAEMLSLETLRCDFSPLTLLLNDRIEWMEISGLDAKLDPEKNIVSLLLDLRDATRVDRVTLHRSTFSFGGEWLDSPLVLNVGDLQFIEGRSGELGVVTMCARLDHERGFAPITLRLTPGRAEEGIAAEASFHFANLDLRRFPLRRLEDAPARVRGGLCSGELVFRLNSEGELEGLELALIARDLDIQPAGGGKLSPIGEARLRMSATVDALDGRVDVSSAEIRLPGVDLGGTSSMYVDLGGEGPWELSRIDFESLNMRGTIHPRRLAVLLTGRGHIGGFGIRGPVGVNLTARGRGEALGVEVAVRADDSEFLLDGCRIKSRGESARFNMTGDYKYTGPRSMEIDELRLSVGGNRISASGSVAFRARDGGFARFTSGIANFDLRGDIVLADPGRARLLPGMEDTPVLSGRLRGPWSIRGEDPPYLSLSLRSMPGRPLRAGDLFEKPVENELAAVIGTAVDLDSRRLKELYADLRIGRGRLSLDKVDVMMSEGGSGFILSGEMEAEQIQDLLACFPKVDTRLLRASGYIKGDFSAALGRSPARAVVSADFGRAAVEIGQYFRKPAVKRLDIGMEVSSVPDTSMPGQKRIVKICADFGDGMKVGGRIEDSLPGRAADRMVSLDGYFPDLRRVADLSPRLSRALGGGRMGGDLDVEFTAMGDPARDGGLEYELSCRSRRLDMRICEGGAKVLDIRRMPSQLSLAGRIIKGGGGTRLSATDGLLALSRSSLRIRNAQAGMPVMFDQKGMTGRARIEWKLDVDELLSGAFPGLSPLRSKHGLSGTLDGRAELSLAPETARARGKVDMGSIEIQRIGRFAKPGDMEAEAAFDVTVLRDLSRLELSSLAGRVGSVNLVAGGSAALKKKAEKGSGGALSMKPEAWYLKLSTDDASVMDRIAPRLDTSRHTGGVTLFADWTAGSGGGGMFRRIDVSAEKFGAILGGKPIRLDGSASLRDVRPDERVEDGEKTTGIESIGRVRTEGLGLGAGKNSAWIVADVKNVLSGPEGSFHALLDYVDVRDLALGAEGAGTAGEREKPKLTAQKKREIEAESGELVESLREKLATASLNGRVTASKLRIYDARVRRYFLAESMEMKVGLDRGNISVEYDTAYNGGTVTGKLTTDTGGPSPEVHSVTKIDRITATDDVRPLVAWDFPGNEVTGLFSRDEDVRYPLRDMLANLADSRYRILPVGRAKMVAEGGVITGQAAPDFVTEIFPGLNLSKYHYDELTGFTTFKTDGSAENEMICRGDYELYIEGRTDRDRKVKYTVGIIIPIPGVRVSAEWHHNWKQGRIPILYVQGRLHEGKFLDQKVVYHWPTETLFQIFLKKNIFYRVWVNSKKKKE